MNMPATSSKVAAMSELLYLLSVLLSLAAYAVAGVALWCAVEAVYFIYCKLRGIKY